LYSLTFDQSGKAYDVSKILVNRSSNACCLLNEQFEFTVDASQAGEGQLEIAVNEGEVANQVTVLGNGRCAVTFKPIQATDHVVDIKFNAHNVPGCPFKVTVTDARELSVHLTNAELLPVGAPATFSIRSRTPLTSSALQVSVTSPSGKTVPVELGTEQLLNGSSDSPSNVTGDETKSAMHEVHCTLRPLEIGPHSIHVRHCGHLLTATPHVLKTFDANRVHIRPALSGCLAKPVEFVVDASAAGEGNLEIAVHSHGRNVLTQVYSLGGAKFRVEFVPERAEPHVVSIAFNGQRVPNSPFTVAIDADVLSVNASGAALHFAPVGKRNPIRLHNVTDLTLVRATVQAPTGKAAQSLNVTSDDSAPNCALIEFEPTCTGEHVIHLAYGPDSVVGSPFTTKAYDLSAIKVKQMPTEIRIGTPITFLVEASNAGPGNLEVIVNNGKVPSTPEALGAALYAITFVPQQRSTHLVHIKFNGELVNGAPFKLHVLDASLVQLLQPLPERAHVHRPISVRLCCPDGVRLTAEHVQVLSPSQRKLSVQVSPAPDSKPTSPISNDASIESKDVCFELKCELEEVGDHQFDVRLNDQSISGCPFAVKAYDSQKVKLSDLAPAHLNRQVYFTIDAGQAGAGNLEIIVSVNGRNVPNYVQSEGNARFRVNFTPNESATHQVSVKFNGQPVPGSPFQVPMQSTHPYPGSDTRLNSPTSTNASCSVSPLLDNGEPSSFGALQAYVLAELTPLRVVSLRRGIQLTFKKAPFADLTPELFVQTPAGKRTSAVTSFVSDSLITFNFVPIEVGPHVLHVLGNKQPLNELSGFTCNVYDVNKVRLSGLERASVGAPLTFQVDASQAGEGTLELVVSTRKCSVRAEVLMRSRGLYDVTFVPHQQTAHYVNVTFNEEDVPGSPFKVDVHPSEVSSLLGAPLHTIPEVTGQDEQSELEASTSNAAQLVSSSSSMSPLPSNEPSVDLQTVHNLFKDLLGRVKVRVNRVHFVIGATCQLNVQFDAQQVQPILNALAAQRLTLAQMCHAQLVWFGCSGVQQSQTNEIPLLSSDEANKVIVEFDPKEPGECRLQLQAKSVGDLLTNAIVLGCADPSRVRLQNVQDALVGQLQQFNVDCSKAGTGELQLQIVCKQQPVACELFELDRSTKAWTAMVSGASASNGAVRVRSKSSVFRVRYRPDIDLPHYLEVLYDSHQVAGCPQLIQVRDPLELLSIDSNAINEIKFMQINTQHELIVNAVDFTPDPNDFVCRVFEVNNRSIDTRLELCPPIESSADKASLRLHFKPTIVGACRIELAYRGRSLTESPLLCECFDISQVRLASIGATDFEINQSVCLELDRTNAGHAELDVIVTSPLGRHLPIELKANDQKELICFVPTVSGRYKVAIAYGGLPVPGTPVTFVAIEPTANVVDSAHRTAVKSVPSNPPSNVITGPVKAPAVTLRSHSCQLHQTFLFSIDANGHKGLPQINVDSSSGEVDVMVEETAPRQFLASFVPTSIGMHDIRVCWAGRELSQSPYRVTAVDLNQVRPKHGWESILNSNRLFALQLNQVKKVTFVTSDAGPAKLRGELMLPNGQNQTNVIESHGNHKYRFVYTPKQAGTYTLNLFYADLLLPQCPLVASATDAKSNGKSSKEVIDTETTASNSTALIGCESRVTLRGGGLAGAFAGQTAQFVVDASAAGAGEPNCTLSLLQADPTNSSNSDASSEPSVSINLEPLGNRVYRVSYTARVAGVFSLNVLWAGKQVAGCPLKLQVAARADAGRVKLQMPKSVAANRKCQLDVQLDEAGPGQLTASLLAPNGQPVNCQLAPSASLQSQHHQPPHQRQTISFVPEVAGKHVLSVRYAGQHVPGSPFELQVGNAPDASKVKVHGPGVEHGVLPLYQSRFVCDTQGAGGGQLTVRIRGPKGAFRVEMARDSSKDRSIMCKYDPTEPGHYRIEVKWSNEHVPHSPFDVYIFDTQAELNRFLSNGT
jgi:filamin